MKLARGIVNGFLLISFLLPAFVGNAQPVAQKSEFATTEYQNYDRYFQRITYIGKRKDHYVVDTFLADSTLFRVDNYKVVDEGYYFGPVAVRHGPTRLLYTDGRLYLTCDYNMNVLNGPLVVYHTDGSIKRKELYRNGKLKKSMCYDTSGYEQVCDPLITPVKFMGNHKELKEYLEKNLQTVLADNQGFLFTISLLINEVSQVIDIKADGGRSNPKLLAGIRRLIQEMPRWRENQSNWQAATMDGRPFPDNWVIYAQRDRNYWRVNIPN